jgi:hypothetical protein
VGEELTAVGWGFTDQTSASGQLVLPLHRMQRRGVAVLGGERDVITYRRHSGDEIIAGAMQDEFIVGESVCNGDSGGPLFDADGKIVGITSRRVSMISVRCVDSPVVFSHPGAPSHASLINAALARAHELGGTSH